MSAPIRTKRAADIVPRSKDMFEVPDNPKAQIPGIPVVRTLKPPPEIWELVHPVPPRKLNPAWAFLTRVTSSGTNLIIMMVAAFVIIGICAFVVIRPDRFETSTTVKPTKISTAARTQATKSDSTVIDGSTAQPISSETADSDSAAGIETISVSVNEHLKGTTPLAGKSKVKASATKELPNARQAVGEKVAATNPKSQPVAETRSEKKSSIDSTSAKPKSSSTLSPQLIAPAKNNESAKAKVIQWPP